MVFVTFSRLHFDFFLDFTNLLLTNISIYKEQSIKKKETIFLLDLNKLQEKVKKEIYNKMKRINE